MFISTPFICSSLFRSALLSFPTFICLLLNSVLHVPWFVPHVPTISVLLFCSPFLKFVLFSIFQICCVLHVPDLFCSLCSKLVLFSIFLLFLFQTCSVLNIPNLYVMGHHFSKFYLGFSRHLAVEQYCSPLWGNC